MLMFVIIPGQFESSGPMRQLFPKLCPFGAYQSNQPQREKKMGRPEISQADKLTQMMVPDMELSERGR